jgi:hypothetical protein
MNNEKMAICDELRELGFPSMADSLEFDNPTIADKRYYLADLDKAAFENSEEEMPESVYFEVKALLDQFFEMSIQENRRKRSRNWINEAVRRVLLEGEEGEKAIEKVNPKQGLVPVVEFLNSKEGSDQKVRDHLLHNANEDEVIKVTDGSKPADSFVPTQKEISMGKSIGWPLSSWSSCKNIPTGDPTGGHGNEPGEDGKKPANRVVVSGNLVVDGHHRWSQVFAIGGKKNPLMITDLEIPGQTSEKLAVTQIAITGTMGGTDPVPSEDKPVKDNILGEDKATIKKKIEAQVGQVMDSGKKLLGDEWCEEAKNDPLGQKMFGIKKDMDNDTVRKTVVDTVAGNLADLPAPAKGAPPRDKMPQFSLKTDPKDVMDNMSQGKVNWKEPFNESIDMKRWHKLAGILKD